MTARRAALAAVLAGATTAGLAPPAAAGTFTVDQCNAALGAPRPAGVQAELWSTVGGQMLSTCGGGLPGALSFYTPNFRLAVNASTDTTFALPNSMPNAGLRAVWLDWRSVPQAPSRGPAFFDADAGGAILFIVPTGTGTTAGSAQRLAVPAGARALRLSTWCSPANGPGWCYWNGPLLQLRAVTAEVEESVEPSASASGPLLAAGAHTGVEPVTVAAGDGDSGVRSLVLTLGGIPVAAAAPTCSADRLPPCPQQFTRTLDVDTRRVPDGAPRLRLTVDDAAGNEHVEDLGAVRVLNHPVAPPRPAPPPARPAAPAPRPPAAAPVPNGYPASPQARVRAWFEWRGRRRLSVTVPPGVRVRIRGRVTDPYGHGIAGAALGLRETMQGWRRAATGVRTRPDGRFTAFTYVGPSRTLRFVYYPYSDSPRPRRGPLLRLRVRRPPHPRAPRTVPPRAYGGAS